MKYNISVSVLPMQKKCVNVAVVKVSVSSGSRALRGFLAVISPNLHKGSFVAQIRYFGSKFDGRVQET